MDLSKLDTLVDLAISHKRYDIAIGIVLAVTALTEDMSEQTKQSVGEKLIDLHLNLYTHAARGTREILAAGGFDDETVKEILLNAQAKRNEGNTH